MGDAENEYKVIDTPPRVVILVDNVSLPQALSLQDFFLEANAEDRWMKNRKLKL